MNIKILASIAAFPLIFGFSVLAAGAKDYQVTGPVLELTNTAMVVQKGSERWEIARDISTKMSSAIKVGDKVTVHYVMTATKVEASGAAGAKEPANAKIGAQKKE